MKKKITLFLFVAAVALGLTGTAFAVPGYRDSFNANYGTSYSCLLCHVNPDPNSQPTTRNAFGAAWASAGHSIPMTLTLANADTDGDGATNGAEVAAGTYPANSNSTPAPATCTSFTYSAWGDCQSNNTQTRMIESSLPAGCTGGSPVTSQTCTYVPPTQTCTSFTYSAWGACQPNNTQTRTIASSSPPNCTGGPPDPLSQSCTYVPPTQTCTSFTYSDWGVCQSNNTQTRMVESSLPAACTGGSPVTSQTCTYVPPTQTCTSFTYSAWGACQQDNTQTRTVATSSPAGCAGGTPGPLSQSCTYVPPDQNLDMSIWIGKTLKVKIETRGYRVGDDEEDDDQESEREAIIALDREKPGDHESKDDYRREEGYLKISAWDPVNKVLEANLYGQNEEGRGRWSIPLPLQYISGTNLNFLCSAQVTGSEDDNDDVTYAFTARVRGTMKGGVLKGTFTTVGGYYAQSIKVSDAPERKDRTGHFRINGKVVPDSRVPTDLE